MTPSLPLLVIATGKSRGNTVAAETHANVSYLAISPKVFFKRKKTAAVGFKPFCFTKAFKELMFFTS